MYKKSVLKISRLPIHRPPKEKDKKSLESVFVDNNMVSNVLLITFDGE